MTTEPDPAPLPLPWLQDAPESGTATADQTWSNNELTPVRLVVRFRRTAADHRRAIYPQTLRQMRLLFMIALVASGLLMGFALALAASLQRVPGAHYPPLLSLLGTILLRVFVMPFVIAAIVTAMDYLLAPLVERFSNPVEYDISREGIRARGSLWPLITWSRFSAIRHEKSGDVHMVTTYGGGAALVVPRSVFADAEAREQFHNALTALWRAQGKPVLVAESVREAFAPPE